MIHYMGGLATTEHQTGLTNECSPFYSWSRRRSEELSFESGVKGQVDGPVDNVQV